MIVILILEKIIKIRKRGLTRGDLHSVVLLHYKTPFILEKTRSTSFLARRGWAATLYLHGKKIL
jgi:hypothetical protein